MTDPTSVRFSGLPAEAVSSTESTELAEGWRLLGTAPGLRESPNDRSDASWIPAIVPGTVAMAVDPDAHPDRHSDYDASDWWYETSFTRPEGLGDEHRVELRFDGLATLAEVWLNGEHVLTSENMFVTHTVDVTHLLTPDNHLSIVFRSLGAALKTRRPRPRWKTKLVAEQRLRWFRTTILGRVPTWTPSIAPVGPWRSIWLQTRRSPALMARSVTTDWSDRGASLSISLDFDAPVERARIEVAGQSFPLDVAGANVSGTVEVDAEPWWPHTHGSPQTYSCSVEIEAAGHATAIDLGNIGFRRVRLDSGSGDEVHLEINGSRVFGRGACWTTNDLLSLTGDRSEMRTTLELLAAAHGNMVRVGGTMVYESDDFYSTCDELGIMVWQDFMFANMDYPADDEAFRSSAEQEARQQTARLSVHPSVVVFCGGSEVEQQAAMFGADREVWSNDLFRVTLPDAVEAAGSGAIYWPSTPTGGAMPFHTDSGITHYYGVGAYKRPLDDCRLAGVRFTPECLGFSNVGEPEGLKFGPKQSIPTPTDPIWKSGIPRDGGSGWDFEDIRDHYLGVVYGRDAIELRSHDLDTYHRLSRTTTGRVMSRVFDEWRSPDNPCGGGLVWFLRDLRPGAGWGILDHDNRPKPVYYYLKRSWAPIRVALLPRGLSGVKVEVHNESAEPVTGRLTLSAYASSSALIIQDGTDITVGPRSVVSDLVENRFGRFLDPTYSYRFGPRSVAAISAEFAWDDAHGSRTIYWLDIGAGLPEAALTASVDPEGASVTVSAAGLARDVRLDAPRVDAGDNYFDMVPGDVVVAVANPKGLYVEAENEPDGTPAKPSDR